jgi:hypothetical protein
MVPGAAREAAGPMMTQPVCIVPESPGLASTPRFAQHPCNVAFEPSRSEQARQITRTQPACARGGSAAWRPSWKPNQDTHWSPLVVWSYAFRVAFIGPAIH